jgi:endoglycosylceramidase
VLRPTLPLLGALLLAGCGAEQPAAGPAPTVREPFHVEDGFLRDGDGRAMLLRGLNLSGQHKYAPYFDFQQPPDYVRVRADWGMNAIRFLVIWAAIEPQEGVYDDEYLDEVAKRMDWARDAGLTVVLDMHQDVYGEGFASGGGDGAPKWTCDASNYASFVPDPTHWYFNNLTPQVTACWDHFWHTPGLRAHYAEAWRRLAARLAGYEGTIAGFDVMNEPYWGSYLITGFESDLLEPFYEDVVRAVRAERPGWAAFLEPSSSRNIGVPTELTPFPFPDVVYAPHSYDANAEMGNGFDPTHRASILMNAAALGAEARGLDAALWVGEYGGNGTQPGIYDYMDAEYTGIAAVAGGSTYWHYGRDDGYGVLDPTGAEKPDLMRALVRPWPERVAGTPTSFAFDGKSSTFTLRYHADRKLTAPTEIMIPARVYPAGYQVRCGGCTVERDEGRLRILTPPPGDEAVVVVSP